MLKKLLSLTFLHKNQLDTPLPGSDTPAAWKAKLDSQAEQLQSTVNTLIDDLGATTAGDSGAKAIGVSPIAGVTGTNVQAVVEDLKLQVNGAVTGSIPDGSITQAKLAFTIATNAASVTIADTGAHFTATNVEGALDELFQSASSVKTNVANAIGAPATSSDTGTVLANRITTEKGRLATEIGDGNNTSTLQYLADRLIARSDAIATAVNGKGVVATSADTLAQLATKISQIITGKQFASGSAAVSGSNTTFKLGDGVTAKNFSYITANGLAFMPSTIIAVLDGSAMTVYKAPGFRAAFPNFKITVQNITTTSMVGTATSYGVALSDGAIVDGTSFQLPVFSTTPGQLYDWIAIE